MANDLAQRDQQRREHLANLDIKVARGVVPYVNRHGGRLYVRGVAYGAGFHRLVASTTAPAELDTVRSLTVRDFDLYIQSDLTPGMSIRLARRWLGFRDGVVAAAQGSVVGQVA